LAELLTYPGKHDVSYEPTWTHDGGRWLNARHERVLDTIGAIEGLLYAEDAQKLYELAWFSPGPILEIGTFRGLSTVVMAAALADSGNRARIVSADIDAPGLAAARASLNRLGLGDRVTLVHGEAHALLRAAPELRPGLVFVDGDHSLRGARADLRALAPVVPRGAIVVLHDYEGYEADDPYAIRVAEAAAGSWLADDAEFLGRFGLCGVFVRRHGGPAAPGGAGVTAPYIELESAATRWRRTLTGALRKLDRRVFHLRRRLTGG
jgi:predicted O-methyltransferase YrrM